MNPEHYAACTAEIHTEGGQMDLRDTKLEGEMCMELENRQATI